ncbi:MAG TPA: polyketide synthase, partial [Kofleriaceae bacterium]|nr:polyketide synthase [Kofleriaceae bacterium]
MLTPFPERPGWDRDALYDPDPDVPGCSIARDGGFLRDAAGFDAAFFGISPREARHIDPQQRVLLETAWEAIERAGIVPRSLEGSQTGVYVGIIANDYAGEAFHDLRNLDGHVGIGRLASTASGRISYTLDLRGPAVSVDTACSSSLVALHLAIEGLRRRDCDLAVAGGVTILATPMLFVEFSRQRGLAPDGRCKAFSDRA